MAKILCLTIAVSLFVLLFLVSSGDATFGFGYGYRPYYYRPYYYAAAPVAVAVAPTYAYAPYYTDYLWKK